MEKGILYWITGLSGAGKTTIGNRLYYQLKKENRNTVILDGDILKKIAGKDLGYSREERRERAYRYCALCKLLTDQGIHVIICTIAMFDEIRDWNRNNIEKYVEVFLDVDLEVLKARNHKGLYAKDNKDTAGVGVAVEFPKNPDIIIKNNGEQSLEKSVQMIVNFQVPLQKRWNHDEEYWNKYYEGNNLENTELVPSLFAQDVFLKYMEPGRNLVEFGCGNGRDSLFFAKNGIIVTGIDASSVAIEKLNSKVSLSNCTFVCEDFVSVEAIYQVQYDYCYSRFTLHAINERQETQILKKAYEMLKDNGYIFIEARSVQDEKYGLGKNVEKNAYIYDGHYRRFLESKELGIKLKEIGFHIVEQSESDQYAPYKDERPVCVRIIAQKVKESLG